MHEATDARGMPLDRWSRIDLPLLRYVEECEAELKGKARDAAAIYAVAETKGLMREVDQELARLIAENYITCDSTSQGERGTKYTSLRLTERGLRAIGMWPTNASAEV